MSEKNPFVDIHCHPTMKPFYSALLNADRKNLSNYLDEALMCQIVDQPVGGLHTLLKAEVNNMTKFSQTNMDSCKEGNLRVLMAALYPVERGWFKMRGLIDLLTCDGYADACIICSSGMEDEVYEKIKDIINTEKRINYFEELLEEYYFLTTTGHGGNTPYVVVNDVDEMLATVNDPNKIAIIVTVEGCHSLCNFDNFKELSDIKFSKVDKSKHEEYKKHKKILFDNIKILKGKDNRSMAFANNDLVKFDHTPFYLTIAHHFWNLICGHADSFGFGGDLGLDQSNGQNKKFSLLGKQVIQQLLVRNNNERRILLDIKHLSVAARREFFEIWETDYHSKGDSFPIIASHTAVNGRVSYRDGGDKHVGLFNRSKINLNDPDIRSIHQSDGLIGIILNNSRLPGKKLRKIIKDGSDEDIQQAYMLAFVANILHIVKVVGEKSAWDMIVIGSDMDGMISGLQGYENASDMETLQEDLVKFLDKLEEIPEMKIDKEKLKTLLHGFTPEQVMDKIFSSNALDFLKKYFHDDFLKHGNKR